MRILLVSYYFAPADTVGALRITRLASFLVRRGHDVRVLAAADPGSPPTLDCDFPEECVLRTSQFDINWLPRRLAIWRRARRSTPSAAFEGSDTWAASDDSPRRPSAGMLREASMLYTNALNWPDARAGWLPYAWRAGQQLLRTWRPDLLYASSPPPTCLLLVKLLSAHCGAPWVAEFRDRWSDDPYYARPSWRQALEARLERRIVASARAVVTVSEPWAKRYAEAYGKPALVVLNGFDADDYAGRESAGARDSSFLEIVYTGAIYPGRRDPTPLFQAIARSPELRSAVRVQFYGTNPSHFLPLAAQQAVRDMVIAHPHIPHAQTPEVQQRADVLLLIHWNDPRDQGHIPAKLFEYLGARRPILGLGLEDGVPARIIRERSAGFFSNNPARIAAQLAAWLDTKRRLGHLPPLSPEAAAGVTRAEQFATLERFLTDITPNSSNNTYRRVPPKRNHPAKLSKR